MNKPQYILKGFSFHTIEDMLYYPSAPNRLNKVTEIHFSDSKTTRVFFANTFDFMIYSVDIVNNEILSVPKEGNYISNPEFIEAEIYCINRTLEHILPH